MATGTIPFPSSGITAGAQPPASSLTGLGSTKPPAIPGAVSTTGMPGATPAQANPYVPPSTSGGGTIPAGGQAPSGTATQAAVPGAGQTALGKQESDIFGSGIGGAITDLLGSLSGTDSAALQNYIKSLIPQEANAQASVNATLGAQGVSGNSSVAAIADSNLKAQEFASIAGESAQLQTQEENLEAGILTGQENLAAQETAGPGLAIFGDILGAAGNATSAYIKATA